MVLSYNLINISLRGEALTMKDKKEYLNTADNQIILGSSKFIHELLNDPILQNNTNLDAAAKSDYIRVFLGKEVRFGFRYTNPESVLQRINRVSELENITNEPLYLMMTLYVLPYLEEFYLSKGDDGRVLDFRVVKRDILHLIYRNDYSIRSWCSSRKYKGYGHW